VKQDFKLNRQTPKIGNCAGRVTNPDGTGLTAVFTTEDGSISPFGTNPLTGKFNQPLPVGYYDFKVQAENYLPQTVHCDVKSGETSTQNITLKKPKKATLVNNKIVLPQAIFFAFDSDVIDQKSYPVLDQVVDVLKKNDKSYQVLKIEGHTDSVGTKAYNLSLSKRRAESVRRYLIDKGLDANRLKAYGFGESKPVATNLTPEGRTENRRVEFNLVRSETKE